MNMPFWRNWIFLWALMPVFSAFFRMAGDRYLSDTVAIEPLHAWGIHFVFFSSALLYLLSPFFVLNRHIRGYGIGSHCLSIFGALIGWGVLFFLLAKGSTNEGFFRLGRDFSRAVVQMQRDTPIPFANIVGLPWSKLLIQETATYTIVYAVPIFAICLAAKRIVSFPKVMFFVALAGVCVAISDAFFDILGSRNSWSEVLNGRPWSERFETIATWSISSVIGACISAIGINSLLERRDTLENGEPTGDRQLAATGFRLAATTAAVLWGIGFCFHYAFGPNGFSSNFAELRKSLTSAPEKDISAGEQLLIFSHFLKTKTYKYPNPNFLNFQTSPDKQTAIVVEAYGRNGSQLAAFDIATGDKIANLGMPFARHESISHIWTKDQKHLVVRSRGESFDEGRYLRHETKITLYSIPDYDQIAQWQPGEHRCQNSETSHVSLVEDDSSNLIVLCSVPGAEDDGNPWAVQLSLPSLGEVDALTNSNRELDGRLYRLIELGGSVYAITIKRRGDPSVVLVNISSPQRPLALDDPFAADRGGSLTLQGFKKDRLSHDAIGMRFCGGADKVSNPPNTLTDAAWGPSFCRTIQFRLSDGSYIDHKDDLETRLQGGPSLPGEYSIKSGALEITSQIHRASKTGSTIVSNVQSGAIIQTLISSAQIPVLVSKDSGLLFTHRINSRQIAVYNIARPL